MAFYSDFDISFEPDPRSRDIKLVTNEQSVAQSIKNLVLTSFYEKPFQPSIGGNIKRFLFEPLDSVTKLLVAEQIKEVVDLFEPRARIEFVDIYDTVGPTGIKLDPHEAVVVVGYYVVNIPVLVTVQILLQRLR